MAKKVKNKKTKLSILMPVYNETINIEIMVKILSTVVEVEHEILIVHDDPLDKSVPTVKKLRKKFPNLKLIHNQLGKGVPNAIKAGVYASKGKYILLFAVDEIGPVLALQDMLQLMKEGCGLVSATRYAYGGRRLGGSIIGHSLSWTANKLLRLFCSSTPTDCSTGIKMFTKKVFKQLTLESKPVGWSVAFELAIKAQVAGIKMGEVPVISIDRLYGGKSTFSALPWIKEYLRWFFWALKNLRLLRKQQKPLVRIPNTTIRK